MDAKTFINNKQIAALEELKTIEADYIRRKEAAQATVAMTKVWLEELGSDKIKDQDQGISLQDFTKKPNETWVSARDLTARPSQAGI